MNIQFIVRIFGLWVLLGHAGTAQWLPQQIPNDATMLLSIDFATANIGAASGYSAPQLAFTGRAVFTTDGGLHWSLCQVPDSARSLVTTVMLNDTLGYIAGAYNVRGNANSTTNVPPALASPVIENARSIQRLSHARIGLSGNDPYRGYFLKTTNGGRHWFPFGSLPDSTSYLIGAFFVSEVVGYLTASDQFGTGSAVILKTTTGGLTWSRFRPPIRIFSLRNIVFTDSLHGAAVGSRDSGTTAVGVIVSTSTGGATWTTQDYTSVAGLEDICFSNSSTGFMVGTNQQFHPVVAKTTDGGVTWTEQVWGDTASLFGVRFAPGTGTGIAFGNQLKYDSLGFYRATDVYVLRTTDNGATWVRQIVTSPTASSITTSGILLSPMDGYL
ncbi:MAG: hypothetical protein AAB393_08870, partial [Bacteroidota bacterium]